MKNLGLLIFSSLVLWAVLIYPAWLWSGPAAFLQSGIALVLCLLPALATMAWTSRARTVSPEFQLVAVLGSSGIRMAVALGGGLAVFLTFPDYFSEFFWIWLLVFYLSILTLEMVLLVKSGNLSNCIK